MSEHKIQVGTILDHSIGCGCNEFWQVTQVAENSVVARRIESKAVNVQPRYQTCDYIPVPDKFVKPAHDQDVVVKRLMVKFNKRGELQVGPIKRWIWWNVWNGKPKQQYSS